MPELLPFRPLRPAPEEARSFSVSAYDSELRELKAGREKLDYLHILSPQLFDKGLNAKRSYEISRKLLQEVLDKGILLQEEKDSLYIYRQLKGNHVFTCVIGLAAIQDYGSGKIKRHELTRTDKEVGITRYFQEVGINGSPVLLTYPASTSIDELVHQLVEPAPLYHFVAEDHSEHFLWRIDKAAELNTLRSHFRKIDSFYIADGHHRCAALAALAPDCDSFMVCLIPDEQMYIHAFHRYLKKAGMRHEKFIEKLKERFEVREEQMKPEPQPGVIDLFMEGIWYSIAIPEELKRSANPRHNLDVYILDKYIFGDILGISDTRTSENVSFITADTDESELIKPVIEGTKAAVFTLYPIEAGDIFRISDIGETMPPKSTWIEPKLRSGLLIHRIK